MTKQANKIVELNAATNHDLEHLCESLYSLSLLWYDAGGNDEWERLHTFIGGEPLPSIYGLEASLHYRGLKGDPRPWQEVYIERDGSGNIESFIYCRAKVEFVKFPICSHHFFEGGLYYEISYNKNSFFSKWKEQQRRAIAFVEGFKLKTE